MGKAGRPPKLTPEVEARLLSALNGGNYRKVACDWAGVSTRAFRDWMLAGKRRPRSRFGQFRRKVLEAERGAEMAMVGRVMMAAKDDPKHAQWWLARKFPERWADKTRIRAELTGKDGAPIEVTDVASALDAKLDALAGEDVDPAEAQSEGPPSGAES